jgi:hypothetical protein
LVEGLILTLPPDSGSERNKAIFVFNFFDDLKCIAPAGK